MCLMRACGCVCVCVCMRGDFLWLRPVRAHVSPCCAAGAAACARGALQVDLLHEGEGAPRMARPMQALRDPVRPAATPPPCAFSAAPALRCCACGAAPGAGPHHAALTRRRRCCRSSAAPSPRVHVCARGRPGARLRMVGAQVRAQHRARSAASGGQLDQAEETVSAPPPRSHGPPTRDR